MNQIKILVVHNLHRTGSASGDDQVFKNEVRLLKKYGHTIIEFTIKNDIFDNHNVVGKLKGMFGMLWSFHNYNAIKRIILDEKPDIMHVHTFFPLLSPSIYYAANSFNCKVVQTVHDTRYACPSATSLRLGKLCDLCCDGKFFRMVRFNCYKNSKSMSLIVALVFKIHWYLRTFYNKIDTYICLNDNQIQLLCRAGFDLKKIHKKYNFTEKSVSYKANDNMEHKLPDHFVVFYGRIGEEKGIEFLCNSWEHLSDIPLVIMGDGPMKQQIIDWSKNKEHIYYLGYVNHEQCKSIVRRSEFVVFPSICYEGCSMVVIESESLGKPLIATNLGFTSEAIIDGYNGFKFKLGDINDFSDKVRVLWNDKILIERLSENAMKDYQNKYTPEDNANQLMRIYHNTLNSESIQR